MATATQSRRTPKAAAPKAAKAISFLVSEDNAGDYRWTVRDGAGASLGQSEPFATREAAHTAAVAIQGAAGSAEIVDQ